MIKIGAYELKTHLSAILDRIDRGEEVIITRHGLDVAELRPVRAKPTPAQAVAELRAWRKENGVQATADEITSWIRESRDSH